MAFLRLYPDSNAKYLLTTTSQCEFLLQTCAATRSLRKTTQIHAHTITSGLQSSSISNSIHLRSNLATAYALCGCIPFARKLFDELPKRSSFLCNTMIRMYVCSGLSHDALKVFVQMLNLGQCRPDNFTYPFVIKACGELMQLDFGVSVHGQTFIGGFGSDTFVQNSLLAMYMSCGEMKAALTVFTTMKEPSVVSWNTLIHGYFHNGNAKDAIMVFNGMMNVGVQPDSATVVSVLPACGFLKEQELGRRVHSLIEESKLGCSIPVRNALVDMYVKCGNMDEARLLFDKMSRRDVVTWTSMINGYILNGDARSALALFWLMQLEGVRPNSVTVASLLSSCGNLHYLKHGRCLHCWVIRQRLEDDVMVETALINMYAKCNHMDSSFSVFAKTCRKRTVPWNAILSGCIQNGLASDAIELFKQMLIEEVEPNSATLNSLLPAYAILADMQQADNMHCYLIKSGFISRIEAATVLIDIYSKCGGLDSAHTIFNQIPQSKKDIVVWSVIIAGYGMHGHGDAAVSLFNQMIKSGIEPNEVTFTSVLHACSHAGLVDEGLDLFKFMVKHQMHPRSDHYTCIVDLLGRAGRLHEAYELIRSMPYKVNHAIWGALLGACVIHGNIELGEVAAQSLFELEPENTGNYILMAKIYAAAGRWHDAESVRYMMSNIGLRKTPAHSLIELRTM